jgi:hypothetical protein
MLQILTTRQGTHIVLLPIFNYTMLGLSCVQSTLQRTWCWMHTRTTLTYLCVLALPVGQGLLKNCPYWPTIAPVAARSSLQHVILSTWLQAYLPDRGHTLIIKEVGWWGGYALHFAWPLRWWGPSGFHHGIIFGRPLCAQCAPSAPFFNVYGNIHIRL